MDIVWQAEDSLREKKVESDLKDLLKTLVAFANSVAPGDTAKIFIGEKNDGAVQGVRNPDNIQKKVREDADKIYPEIYYRTEVYERDGKQCVRVDIKHNGLGPHFGGAAWVRKGSETIRATGEIYQQLIDLRQSKVTVLLPLIGQPISVRWRHPRTQVRFGGVYTLHNELAQLKLVNAHWLTFGVQFEGHQADFSESMENVQLSWDDSQGILEIIVMD
jgi:Putative DNA-binding domain